MFFHTKTIKDTPLVQLVDGITSENVVQLGPQIVARAAWRDKGLRPCERNLG